MAGDYDLKIFGERNTSTNALSRIVQANSRSCLAPSVVAEIDPVLRRRLETLYRLGRLAPFRGLAYRLREAIIDRSFRKAPDLYAWKHAATRFEDVGVFAGLSVLVTVRHPASWVLSLFKNPYQLPPGRPGFLDGFLDCELTTVGRERLGGRALRPLDLYAEKLRAYLDFFEQLDRAGIPWRVVPFETLVMDQPRGFAAIRDLLTDPTEDFEPLRSSTKSSDKSLATYQAYYGDELWRDELGPTYDRIRKEFPETLAAEFGYTL
jgi:hypothetical protein